MTEASAKALAACLEFLIDAFWGPDQEECAATLPARISGLRRTPGLPRAVSDALDRLAAEVPEQGLADFCRDLAARHVALFVSARGGTPAPLYQSCYEGDGRLMGEAAQAMARRLAGAGLSSDAAPGEPPDHLCIELEFLWFLLSSERCAEAASLAGEVMLPWVRTFCARFAAAPGFYGALAGLLRSCLEAAVLLHSNQPSA